MRKYIYSTILNCKNKLQTLKFQVGLIFKGMQIGQNRHKYI